jgi:uncharacterized protein YvpB
VPSKNRIRFTNSHHQWKHLARTNKVFKRALLTLASSLILSAIGIFSYLNFNINNNFSAKAKNTTFPNLIEYDQNGDPKLAFSQLENTKFQNNQEQSNPSTTGSEKNQEQNQESETEPTIEIENTPDQTILEKINLPVPYRSQIFRLSCEAASLQMALSYYKINISQNDLQEDLGISQPFQKQTLVDADNNQIIVWGNPDEAFVGDVEGWYYKESEKEGTEKAKNEPKNYLEGTGWGVNNGPIAKLAKKYRPNSLAIDNAKLSDLKEALRNKAPVIMWHIRDDADKEGLEYQSEDGKKFKVRQTHVKLLTGFETIEKTDPKTKEKTIQTSYLFQDPYYGQDLVLDEDTMLRQWQRYGNQIVIVN